MNLVSVKLFYVMFYDIFLIQVVKLKSLQHLEMC